MAGWLRLALLVLWCFVAAPNYMKILGSCCSDIGFGLWLAGFYLIRALWLHEPKGRIEMARLPLAEGTSSTGTEAVYVSDAVVVKTLAAGYGWLTVT